MHPRADSSALSGRVLQRGAGGLLFRIALSFIISIVSTEAAQAKRAQLENARHLCQQFTIVRSHQHAALMVEKLVVKPFTPLSVQMVRGFIQ